MKEKRSSFKVAFPIASVWFGALVGPSMISGAFAVVYFSPYGMWGIILPLICMGVASTIITFGLLGVKVWHIDNYSDYGKKLYGKYATILSPLLELYIVLAMIIGGSSVIVMGGIFFNDLFGLPIMAGQILMAIISSVLVLWGAELVRRSSAFMTVVMLIGFVVIVVMSCFNGIESLQQKVTSWYVPEGVTFWMGLGPAIALGFSNAPHALTLSSVGQKIETNKDVILAGFIAFVLNSFMFIGCVFLLLPYMPEVLLEDVPNLYVINNYLLSMAPWLPAVYSIVMLFGLASSGAPQLNAVVYRADSLYPKKGIFEKSINRNICTSVIYMTTCIAISSLGLRTIIGSGYSMLGYLAVPLIAFPLCVLLPIRIWKNKV